MTATPPAASTIDSSRPWLSPGGFALLDRALATCQLPPGARLMDVGCGTGAAVDYLRSRHGLAAFGLDVAPPAAACLPMVRADAEKLPIACQQLDAVLCQCTLSLLPAPAMALRAFRRILRPDGWLLLSDIYALDVDGIGIAAGSGQLSWPVLNQLLGQCGFVTQFWEDQTGALKYFLGQLIFECGALPAAWHAAVGGRARRLGYFSLVARRA